jgi:hypothetical protein
LIEPDRYIAMALLLAVGLVLMFYVFIIIRVVT